MVCENCKAEYDNTYEKCPYCGAEVQVKAKSQREIRARRKKLVGLISCIVLAAVIIIYGLITYFTGVGSKAYKEKKKNLKILEGYLKAEDYKGISEKVSKIKGAAKDKDYICFYSISVMYQELEPYNRYSSSFGGIKNSGDYEIITDNARGAFEAISRVYDQYAILEAKYKNIENNNQYMEKYLDKIVEECSKIYELSADDIWEIMKKGTNENEIIESYIDIVYRKNAENPYITDSEDEDP